MTIVLNDFYKASNPLINEQHEKLRDLVHIMASSHNDRNPEELINNALTQMSNFVIDRFKKEEKLMKDNNLSFYLSHRSFHEQFSDRLTALIDSKDQNIKIFEETFELLCTLVNAHISSEDETLLKWLEENKKTHFLYAFKTCTLCLKHWNDVKMFLADPTIKLVGYQPDFSNVSLGLFLFNHEASNCGTTMAISMEFFSSLADKKLKTVPFSLKIKGCPSACGDHKNLNPCHNTVCPGTTARNLIQIVKDTQKELCG